MIKKLQRKFIMITAVSLLSVLAVVVAAINIINSCQLNSTEQELISMIGSGSGIFSEHGEHYRDDRVPPDDSSFLELDKEPSDRSFFKDRRDFNEETRYQTRFFIVWFAEDGSISRTDTMQIAAVDEEEAAGLAEQAKSSGKESGRIGDYRYSVSETDEGVRVIFLDCHQNDRTKQRFLIISVLISAVSWVLVLLLITLLSRRAIKPVIAAHEKQKQFITDASHEIKTPLAIISANTEVLELTSEPNEWTESTKNQIKRLDGLVKDLMRLSKMDEAETGREFVRFDISEVVMKEAAEFEAPARTHGESFSLDIDEGLEIVGDSELVRQAVGIFCDNAVKYCDDGGSINVSLKPHHKGIRLAVTNSCKQPPEGDLSRLFDRFYRADEARQRKGSGGYGIGLSIAKANADVHKAKADCRASDGKITFSITFRA